MPHFELESWTDFVRGAATPELDGELRAHLTHGCGECAAIVRRLRAVEQLAAADRLADVPDHLVRFARAAFTLHKPEAFLGRTALAARVLFSTGDMIAAAGMRGLGETASRQSLYEAGDYSVHLKFEYAVDPSRVSLVGQVANRRAVDPTLSFFPVLVARGRRIVARALSNEFGEFQLEYERSQRDLQLHIPVAEEGRSITLALGALTDES